MKRWFFSSFLVYLLAWGLAGAQVVSLAALGALTGEEGGAEQREEQTSRAPHESRATTREKTPRLLISLNHPTSLVASFPLAASLRDDFVAVGVALPDKIPILCV